MSDPSHEATGPTESTASARDRCHMIANGFGLLALFSLISFLLSEDRRRDADPRNDFDYWMWVRR